MGIALVDCTVIASPVTTCTCVSLRLYDCMQAARLVEHGYVRKYMRSLLIADVVNRMTDFMSPIAPSPVNAMPNFHMAMPNSQEQSPDSLHSMPTVTSTGLHTSPAEPQQQQQQQQQQHHHLQQHQQQQHQDSQADQQPDFRNEFNRHLGCTQSGENGSALPALQAMISPRHSAMSGPSPSSQQLANPGRPPTPRAAKRS